MELNRLKVVLVERKKTGKWLAETLVQVGEIEFRNGSSINCLLNIKK